MRDSTDFPGYRVAIVTLDSHAAGPAARVLPRLIEDFPGLQVSVHAAAEWAETPGTLEEAENAIAHADIVIVNILFLEAHVQAILHAPILSSRPCCSLRIISKRSCPIWPRAAMHVTRWSA